MKLFVMALLLSSPVYAQTPWIHVEVNEGGTEDSHVKVNLPLSLVRVALEVAPDKMVSKGRVHLGHGDVEVEDLRRMWHELRDSGDAELASVESTDENVLIRREGDAILISVDGKGDGEQVSVEVPVDVIDALLAGEGNELDVLAALNKLDGQRGEIVRVADGETQVRVWIDERD